MYLKNIYIWPSYICLCIVTACLPECGVTNRPTYRKVSTRERRVNSVESSISTQKLVLYILKLTVM